MDQNAHIDSLEHEVLALKSELATIQSNYATKLDLCRSELQMIRWVGLIVFSLLVMIIIGIFAR